MSIFYHTVDQTIVISGKTYPHRDKIKRAGAKFNGTDKTWVAKLETNILKEIHQICIDLGGGPTGGTQVQDHETPPPRTSSTQAKIDLAIENQKSAITDVTVAELMYKAGIAINQAFPRSIWVIGEIQNLNSRKHGLFLSLAENKSNSSETASVTVNGTIWGRNLKEIQRKHGMDTINSILEEGLRGRFLCQVSLYKDRGQVTLNIMDIDPDFTKGALALAREALLKELRSQGLDRKNKALQPTMFPLQIGLISADGSRAQSDFLDQLSLYGYPGKTIFYDSQMQGEAVLKTVVHAVRKAINDGCDYIVITRGGGSAADLRWFDSKEVALAVAESPVPIIAAIGHHDDVCIAEEIAFQREKTPTAAADFILHQIVNTKNILRDRSQTLGKTLLSRFDQFQKNVNMFREKLSKSAEVSLLNKQRDLTQKAHFLSSDTNETINQNYKRLLRVEKDLKLFSYDNLNGKFRDNHSMVQVLRTSPNNTLKQQYNLNGALWSKIRLQIQQQTLRQEDYINHKRTTLAQNSETAIQHWKNRLITLKAELKSHDPKPWLKTGWTQLRNKNGQLKSIKSLKVGDSIKAKLSDGNIKLKVTHIE